MMGRVFLIGWVLLSVFMEDALAVEDKTYRIGMVLYRGETDAERGFRQYLSQNGVRAEYLVRDAAEDPKRLPAIVEEMRALRPDLIYAFGTSATIALVGRADTTKGVITDIPVVFNIVADPVGSGITRNMSGSGRNVTGVTHLVPIRSQLSALRSAISIKTMAVIYSANEKNAVLSVNALEQAAPEFNFTVQRFSVGESSSAPTMAQLTQTLEGVSASRPDIVYVPSDSFLIRHADLISERLTRVRIPSMSATEAPIRQNGLVLGLVSPYLHAGAFAGHKALSILVSREEPGQIPISGLDRFTFLINIRSALAIEFYPKIGALGYAEIIGNKPRAVSNTH